MGGICRGCLEQIQVEVMIISMIQYKQIQQSHKKMSQRKQKFIRKHKQKTVKVPADPLQDSFEENEEIGTKISATMEMDNDTAINKITGEDSKAEEDGKHNEEDNDLEGFRVIKPLLMNLKDVAILEPQMRSKLKQQHGHLAEYIFMSQREKCKYFHEKNLKYNRIMETPGSLPAKKISFKRNFEVKVFCKEETPSHVKAVKSRCDKYNPKIHYS